MTLNDGYGSMVVVDALIRTRDAVVDPTQTGPLRVGRPALRVPQIKRWDGWVRTFLGVQSLLEGLRFEAPQQAPDETKAAFDQRRLDEQDTLTVGLFASFDTSLPLVSVKRPPHTTFEAQLAQVLDWAELRPERSSEILAQVDNQYAFWGAIVPIHTSRMQKTADLIEAVIQFAVFVEARFKHEFNAWRPTDLSPQVQPMITTPGHGAFPSGHCTQSYAVAHVLGALLGVTAGDLREQQLQRLAARISTNRVVAGVHFPVDNLVGRLLGRCLGEYAVRRFDARAAAPMWQPRFFDGAAVPPTETFSPTQQPLDGGIAYYQPFGERAAAGPAPSDVLSQMWKAAADECDYLR